MEGVCPAVDMRRIDGHRAARGEGLRPGREPLLKAVAIQSSGTAGRELSLTRVARSARSRGAWCGRDGPTRGGVGADPAPLGTASAGLHDAHREQGRCECAWTPRGVFLARM